MRSAMMLRWISLVPPMIEFARVDSSPRIHRPRSEPASPPEHEERLGPEHVGGGLVRCVGSGPPRTASRCSTPRRSPRPARAGRACARCGGGRSRRRSTTARVAGARPRVAARDPERGTPSTTRRSRLSCSTCSRQMNDAPRSLASVVLATRQPLVLRTDEILDRHLDVVEEDLVELVLAGQLAERAHVDAVGVHRDREHRDALCAAAPRGRSARVRFPCRR